MLITLKGKFSSEFHRTRNPYNYNKDANTNEILFRVRSCFLFYFSDLLSIFCVTFSKGTNFPEWRPRTFCPQLYWWKSSVCSIIPSHPLHPPVLSPSLHDISGSVVASQMSPSVTQVTCLPSGPGTSQS